MRQVLMIPCVAMLLIMGGAQVYGDALNDYKAGMDAFNRGDVVSAINSLQLAADQGHVPAMLQLGFLLDKSEQNEAAFQMYSRAAKAGSLEGVLAVGVMYANGEGVKKDHEKAVAWITRSAEGGHGAAITTLALVYLKGDLGMAPSRELAVDWLQKGIAAGHEPARLELERLQGKKETPKKQ